VVCQQRAKDRPELAKWGNSEGLTMSEQCHPAIPDDERGSMKRSLTILVLAIVLAGCHSVTTSAPRHRVATTVPVTMVASTTTSMVPEPSTTQPTHPPVTVPPAPSISPPPAYALPTTTTTVDDGAARLAVENWQQDVAFETEQLNEATQEETTDESACSRDEVYCSSAQQDAQTVQEDSQRLQDYEENLAEAQQQLAIADGQ